MATVAELIAMPHREVGFVLFIEGCPFAVTTHPDLAGSGASSWIGTGHGARRVLEGLSIGKGQTVTHSTSLESGMLENSDGTTFEVQDFDGELVEFMRDQTEAETLGELLLPTDDPAPATLLSSDGQTSINLWGRYINKEAIGPAGERNYYQVFPGDPMPGLSHAAYTGDLQSLAPSMVYDSPPFLQGRRVALWMIVKDIASTATGYQAWKTWSQVAAEQADTLVFIGTLNQPEAEGRTWKLPCDGMSSLLRKQLNANRPDQWQKVSATISLSDEPGAREDLMGLKFYYQEGGTGTLLLGAESLFDETLDVLPTTGTPFSYRAAISNRITTVSGTAGVDITYTAFYNATASISQGYCETSIDDAGWGAVWILILHEKTLRMLGYDPILQQAGAFESEYEITFLPSESLALLGIITPGPGYWGMKLSTAPLGAVDVVSALDQADNQGAPRYHRALTDEGVDLLYPGGDQELLVGLGPATPFIMGQTNRAPGEHIISNSGGEVDTQGYFAFRSSYLENVDAEVITMVQIAKCGWHNDDIFNGANFGENADGYRVLWVERWIDARWFGCDRKPLDQVWASLDLEYAPIAWIGYNLKFGDRADLVLLRTMLSTGTASWSGYDGQNPVRTFGVNAHPNATYTEGDDVEDADLGLAIPASLIDYKSFTKTASLLPDGGADSPLNRVKFGFLGSFDSQELIARILAPRGWGMGWVRGKLRLFSLAQPLSQGDVEVSIDPDDFVSDEPMYIEQVDYAALTAKDKFKITAGGALIEEAAPDKDLIYEVRANDPGARARQSNAELDIDGAGLIRTDLWEKNGPQSWGPAWSKLWSTTMSEWYGAPAVRVQVTLHYSKARLLGPGSIVRFSSYFAPGRDGVYGLNLKLGRVTSIERDLFTGTAVVAILLQPGTATFPRRFAPIAFVLDDVADVEERHDATARTFYCYENYFGHEGDQHDVTAFAEPDWLGVGGDATVHGWQWNGREWAHTMSFEVESISTAGNLIVYKPGSMTGTFHESQYCCLVMAPYDTQAADSWPRALFSVHTRANFTFGTGPTKGFKLT